MKRRIVLAPLAAAILLLGAAPAFAQDKAEEPVSSEPDRPVESPAVFVDVIEYKGGDGDGVPEPGERLTVVLGLFNGSERVLTEVSATLESLTDSVAVLQGTSTYPDIQVRDSAQGADSYVIQIAPDAETQAGCEGMPTEPMVIDDGGAARDLPASDDGQTQVAPAPGEPGDGGGSEPSYGEGEAEAEAGESGEGTVTTVEEGTVTPEEPPAEEPQQIEPSEPKEEGVVEPDGTEPGGSGGTEPGVIEPAPQDTGVALKMMLKVTASGQQYDLPIDNGVVCMYSTLEQGRPEQGAPAGGTDDKALAAAERDAADGSPVGSRSAAPIAGVLLMAVAALLLRWAPSIAYRRAMQ